MTCRPIWFNWLKIYSNWKVVTTRKKFSWISIPSFSVTEWGYSVPVQVEMAAYGEWGRFITTFTRGVTERGTEPTEIRNPLAQSTPQEAPPVTGFPSSKPPPLPPSPSLVTLSPKSATAGSETKIPLPIIVISRSVCTYLCAYFRELIWDSGTLVSCEVHFWFLKLAK